MTAKERRAIIKENKLRLAASDYDYNPIVGTECNEVVRRRAIRIIDSLTSVNMNLPTEMFDEPLVQSLLELKSLRAVSKALTGTLDRWIDVWNEFEKLRCKYDFEYWCAVDVKITHKTEGRVMPFILNEPQREIYLPELERLRKADKPINIDLLKTRQWGGSTMTEFYINWIQRFWRLNWNSCIVADVDDQAKGILGMYERATAHFDIRLNDYKSLEMHPYAKQDSVRAIDSRDCTIAVGSAQHPEKIRSQDLKCAHLTEVGLWKKTQGKSPEDIVQTVFGSILNNLPYTVKVLESTAKGVGNFFHRHWLSANSKEHWNGFTPVFVPWFVVKMYRDNLEESEYDSFVESLSDYEMWLFKIGATLEGIKWYRITLAGMGEPWRMKSEFPSSADEAFQSTGMPYFNVVDVENMRDNCTEPILVGDIDGDALSGKESLNNVRIYKDERGNLRVWEMPDEETRMSERYLVTVDLGVGRTEKADKSIICVFDRYWCTELGGMPEVVAEWAGHLDMDLLAWKAAQIATIYGNALLVVESNSAESSKTDHFRTILAEIGHHYDNMYRRDRQNKIEQGGVARYGFHTNGHTKTLACDYLNKAIRDGLYIERNIECIDEMRVFERKQDGRLGAVDGCHDDRVMTRAIGAYFLFKEGMMGVPMFLGDTSGDYTAGGDF